MKRLILLFWSILTPMFFWAQSPMNIPVVFKNTAKMGVNTYSIKQKAENTEAGTSQKSTWFSLPTQGGTPRRNGRISNDSVPAPAKNEYITLGILISGYILFIRTKEKRKKKNKQ